MPTHQLTSALLVLLLLTGATRADDPATLPGGSADPGQPVTEDDGIAPPPRGSVWRQTGPDGRVIFTDTPPPGGAEPVVMPKINQVPGMSPEQRQPPTVTEKPFAGYERLVLRGVAEGATLLRPQDPVVIRAHFSPPLQPGHQLVILHNGAPLNTGSETVATITWIPRGKHTFTARILDDRGKALIEASPLTFQVQRPLRRDRR